MENRLAIAGELVETTERRVTPAGIPIVRFRLHHRSRRLEAGRERLVSCELQVVACGEPLASQAQALNVGDWVRITGFLSRSDHRHERRLVIHAETIGRGERQHD